MANADPAASVKPATPSAEDPDLQAQDPKAAAKPPRPVKARHYLEAGLTHLFMGLLKLMNLPLASSVGGSLARGLGPLTRPWRIAQKNLQRAAPETSQKERTKVIRSAFDNFGRVMAEYALLPRLWGSRWDGIIDVDGAEGLSWAVRGKAAIVFSAHIGNWELIPMALAAQGKPCLIVYRPANNPLVDKIIAGIRSRYIAGMAPKGAEGLRDIVKHIQDGGTVFMLVDQKTNTGSEIPFFGRGARTGRAIARLAMKYGCKLIPAHCMRLGGGPRFRISFEPPWSVEGNANDEDHVRKTLTRINAKIEEWVRAAPGQWLWMHKRWPD